MRAILAAALTALSVSTSAVAAPGAATTTSPSATADLLAMDREARALLGSTHNNDADFCGPRLRRMLAFSGRAGFDRLPPDTRRATLAAIVACEDRQTREPEVIALIRRLEPLADAPALIAATNAALIDGDDAAGQPVRAGRRLLTVIENAPDMVGGWWEPYLTPLIHGAAGDDKVYAEIVRRLQTVTWTDETSAAAARNSWALLRADLLVNAGDIRGAEKALAGADELDTLVMVAQERAYAPLWPKLQSAGRLDWRKMVERELVFRKKLSEAFPDSLRMAIAVQRRLRLLERYDEAITFGQAVRKRLSADETFTDREGFAGPVLGELAFALLDTGKTAEGEAVFKEAMTAGENGDNGVSQRIDWAGRLNGLGRHAEALALLKDVKPADVSPFGAMWLAAERTCALSRTDPAKAWAYLTPMLLNQADGPIPMQKAMLCLDRQEEAAAYYVQRLKDPTRRADALGAARIVRKPPGVGAFDAELARRRDAVLARPDVRKAIDEAGRAIDLPLSGPVFGWY